MRKLYINSTRVRQLASLWLLIVCMAMSTPLRAAFEVREVPTLPRLTATQLASIQAGSIHTLIKGGRLNRGEVYAVVPCKVDKVWQTIIDYDNYTKWYPDIVQSKVLSTQGTTQRVQLKSNLPFWFEDKYLQQQVTYTPQPVMLDGKKVYIAQFNYIQDSGNIKDIYGYWLIYDNPAQPNTTMLKYVANIDIGIWTPEILLRWAQRQLLPTMLANLAERSK